MPTLNLRGRLLVTYLVPTALTLALLVGFAWRLARRDLEAALGERLVGIAQVTATSLRPRDAEFLQPGDEEGRIYTRVREQLEKMRAAAGLRRVVLFDRDGKAIADSGRAYAIGTPIADLTRDQPEVGRVLAGDAVASEVLFRGEDERFYKSGYAPVVDEEGRVVAGVLVDGSAAFFEHLTDLARSLAGLALLGILAIVAASWLFSRQLAHPIRNLSSAADRIGSGDLETPVALDGSRAVELKILAAALETMRADLSARDRQLQMMLSGIAHEVRNPLGGIELFSGLLAEELPEDDERRSYVERIRKELNHLARLVEEFLDFAREREPERGPVDAEEMLHEIAGLVSTDAEARHITVSVETSALTLDADAGMLRRALLNLARNAVQAAPDDGQVVLAARTVDAGAILEVRDSGPGLGEQDPERLFEPFFTTKEKGSGLGLALVKKAAELHGGTVEVGVADEGGARFSLTIPPAPAPR